MGGYIGPTPVLTQIDGYNKTQADALLATKVNDTGDTLTGALNEALPVLVPSAASVAIGATNSNNITISGTTTITSFDVFTAGAVRRLTFAGALTLTHNATYLILPGGANITTTAGDVAEFVSLGSGNWRCSAYLPASQKPGGNGLTLQSVFSVGFVAVAGNSYPVNTTSGPITVVLPASPTAGQQVNVFDYAGNADINNITVSPNGGRINSQALNAVISTRRASLTFLYLDSTQGWVIVSTGSPALDTQSYSASYLVVAGGGGGGSVEAYGGGGGGAGGYLSGSGTLFYGTTYSVTVGGGGGVGGSGSASAFASFSSAVGGGVGGYGSLAGGGGGSGGGGGGQAGAAGAGTSGQGNSGGTGSSGGSSTCSAGGGGGAGAVGGNGVYSGAGGAGGIGVASSITGVSVYYAGGGGGGGVSGGGTGGTGGGGSGSAGGGVATAGTANTGGGGGGSKGVGTAASGGSGVVILSIPTANYSGRTTGSPTVTTSGSNTILTFTSSGSYTA